MPPKNEKRNINEKENIDLKINFTNFHNWESFMSEPESDKNIEIRLVIKPEDNLFTLFSEAKAELGLISNNEVARALIKKGHEHLMSLLKKKS